MSVVDILMKNSDQFDFCFTASEDKGQRELCHANQFFYDTTGYSEQESMGKNCKFLQGPDTSEDHIKNIREALNKREATFQEIRNYRKNGEPFINRLIILPLRNFILGFQNEVPEKERLLSLHDLKIADADINHYINNPLTVLYHDLSNQDFEKAKNNIMEIRNFIMSIDSENNYPKVY